MKRILSVLTLAVCAIFMVSNASAQDNYNATTMGEKVYLETASWGQNSPFNNLCPTVGTTPTKTGCGPTAFAILCHYYKWPECGTGTVTHNNETLDLSTHYYDYENMLLSYSEGYNEVQATAVATLMRDLGYAAKVTYGTGNTEFSENITSLKSNFAFNNSIFNPSGLGMNSLYRSSTTDEEFIRQIKECLNQSYPVLFSSTSLNPTTGKENGRHIFIIDGYTENNYFHFNFGWAGSGNGWYTLDNVRPDEESDYSTQQRAYLYVIPNATKYDVTATATPSNMGTVSINNGTAGSTATANLMQGATATLTAHPAQGYALASWTKNGEIVGTKNTLQVKVGTSDNDYVANFDDEANVYVTKDYIISPSTVGLTGTYKESVVNYVTSDEYPAALSLASTATNGTSLSAMSRISDDQIRLYAYDQATSSTTVKYTLSVPDGYQITEYKFDYSINKTDYPCSINYSGGTVSSPKDTEWHSLSPVVVNAKTAEFTISAENAHSSSNFYIKNFIVTVAKISAEGGSSTPTTTTYTINATAGAGGSVTINGEAVSQKSVNKNSTVTLVATPSTGYRFVNWTSGTSPVSTDATYEFTATGNTSLVANFEQTQYTVTVAAGVGGSAYIGTKGTTEKTVSHNENVTITAEANDGYRFVEWRAWNSHFSSIAQQDVTVTTDVTYTAVFEPVLPITGTEVNATFTGATGFANQGYTNQVVLPATQTAPAITFSANDPKIGYSTIEGTKYPYLFKGTNFTISVPAPYKIAGYKLTVQGHEFNAGTFTYTVGTQNAAAAMRTAASARSNTATATISGTTPLSVVATGLNTSEINIGVGSASAETAGIIVKELQLDLVQESQASEPEYTLGDRITSAQLMSVTKPTHIAVKNLSKTNNWYFAGTTNVADFGNEAVFVWTPKTEGVAGEYYLKTLDGKYLKATGNNTAISYTEDVANAAVFTTLKPVAGSTGTSQLGKDDDTDTRVDDYNLLVRFMTKYTGGTGDVTTWINVTHSTSPNHPKYYSGGYGMYTAHFVYAVSVDGVAPEIPDVLFPDGAYKIYWQADNRGYLAYHATARPEEAVLADVTYTGHAGDHYNSSTDPVDLVWYLITASNGKRYLFQAATGKFLGANPSVDDNGIANKLSTTEAWPINVEKNTHSTRLGHYIITTVINGTPKLLCSGCGTSSFNGGHSVRWLTVNDGNQKDGGAPLQLISVNDVTVSDDVMNDVRAVIEPRTFKFQAVVDGWRENNPNTHLGTITIGGTAVKLTPAHQTASELTMPLAEGTTLAFTRKYRGFEFQGFYIGSTKLDEDQPLTAENVAAIDENNPLIAKFTPTDDVTLFYDDDEFSYRIPAIVKTVKDDKHKLIAISDYRHSFDDIGRDNHQTGTTQVDLVIRTSEDNGATWSAKQTIAEGSQRFGYGDAAAVANGQDVLVMAVAGNVFYAYANSENPQQAYRIYSNDNGETWEKEDISSNMESLFPDYYGLFFGSGKLAVDPDFNGSGNARVYGAILMKDSQGERNYVLYSDNWGKTWNILGNAVAARQNEPKVEILPNGQILLSARRGSGRTFNVFTYTDKANNAGTWSTATDGCNNGGNSTNGEIICLDAKRTNGMPTKILLQSQPYGSDRRNVSIWYKEISANEPYTASSIASDWTMGKQVSTQLSAYSAMCLQENGEIALFFEEAPCYGDDHTKGYSMVYVPLTIEEITENNFRNPNADIEYVPVEFNIVLTDAQGNEYRETLDYIPADAAAVASYLTNKYPFITLGNKGAIADNKYTNTVTLPFKVSNANTTVWHNIYWPANTNENLYPVYMLANTATDIQVAKVNTSTQYGNSQYNTLEYADKLSWAIYSVDYTLNFKLKNKVTQKYIQVTSVGTGDEKNAVYAEDGKATAFTLQEGTGSRAGSYNLIAKVDGAIGYLCSTSTGNSWATHYNGAKGNDHHGAWVVFKEEEVVSSILDLNTASNSFGEGALHVITDEVQRIITALESPENITLNTLVQYGTVLDDAMTNWKTLTLTVNDAMGSVTINNESRKTKKAPSNYEFTVVAKPANGYSFVKWTDAGGNDVSPDASYTFNMPDAATELTANFVKDDVGYYNIVSRVTSSHEHLYNNALRTNNTKKYTLQSDSKVTTNNGIWRITKNGNQWKIKNGDGNVLVTGANYCGAATPHNTLNIEKTTDVGGVTYYSFTEGINCTNRDQYNFTLEGGNHVSSTDNNYVTTWTGHPDDQANQWRIEPVDTEGKNIYDVVVECTTNKENVYVTYGSEYAFNGGFFITDATITAQQLTANAAQDVKVLVEGNTIKVVDIEYVGITVNASPAEGGTITINGEATSTKQVAKDSEVTVVATPTSGYQFVNWTKGTEVVSTKASYTFTINDATELTANFKGGYYHLISKATSRHEHLYNNAFSNGNTNHLTLQSDSKVETNNGIWHITKNGNQWDIKNGDGKPVVAGNDHEPYGGIKGTFSQLNISSTTNDGYYYFSQALNCSNVNSRLKVGETYYLTTWSDGGASADDNLWRLEPVDIGSKNIYDVVVECTDKENVYVTYGSEYAFNGGFFITDATITADQLTAKKGNDAAQGVKVLVDGNTIKVVDKVYHTITVSTYYDDNKGGTVKVGEENATSVEVNVAEGGSVTMSAIVANGYEFMGWLKDGVIVKNAIDNGLDFEVQGPEYTLYNITAPAEYKAVFSKITETTGLEDGKAYRICGVQGNGQARCIYRDGNELKWKYDYDNNDVNTIFVAQKNGNAMNLISAVGYHGWKESYMLGNDEQNNPYAAIKVTYGTRDELRTLYVESGTSSGLFQTNTGGAFSFQNSRGRGLTMTATDETTTDFLFQEVDTYAFQVSAADGSNAKLGTVNLPFATKVPAEVTVYGVDNSNETHVYVEPLELTDNVLPANTPVLIEAETAGKYGFKPAPASANVHETGFAGTLEAEAIPGTTNAYILSYNGAGTAIKLYKLSSTSTERTINANKAYYIDATGKASALQFVFGGTTDIEEVEREGIEDTIYDLQGRKLSEITEPGIYIINGKKVYKK